MKRKIDLHPMAVAAITAMATGAAMTACATARLPVFEDADDAAVAVDTGAPPFDAGPPEDAGAGFGPVITDAGPTDGPCVPNLTGTIRDFTRSHPDFERYAYDDRGIVLPALGADQKPVYAHAAGHSSTTTSKVDFDQWYRDTPGINMSFPYQIQVTTTDAGISTFAEEFFFPIDGKGYDDKELGEDQKLHNFWFTFELHTTFQYTGGERFTFLGDDDVWVFINKQLVVDLGGVHTPESSTVVLDDQKAPLGLVVGVTYPLDIFQAERHSAGSHFRMDTSIRFNNCDPIIR
jgi:fibro-slime domain-containing protein